MKKLIKRETAWCLAPEGEPIFSELAYSVAIDDEGAGEFVVVSQEEGKLLIDTMHWQALRELIDHAVAQCREDGA